MGLEGEAPETIVVESIADRVAAIREGGGLNLLGGKVIDFNYRDDLVMHRNESLPYHANGLRFSAWNGSGDLLAQCVYYSVGGGFVVNHDDAVSDRIVKDETRLPYDFSSGDELLALCREHQLRISEIMMANELVWRDEKSLRQDLLKIWDAMQSCISRGFTQTGNLPGGLNVERRAPALFHELKNSDPETRQDPLKIIDWVNLYALAVNEENAAGGRVVTAPTNGAAGIIPAVGRYYLKFVPNSNEDGIVEYLLTAGAIGILYLLNASISGAEVGCQG
jgi:L-serine dehydratase